MKDGTQFYTAIAQIRAIFDALTAIDNAGHSPLDNTVANLAETGIKLSHDAEAAFTDSPNE